MDEWIEGKGERNRKPFPDGDGKLRRLGAQNGGGGGGGTFFGCSPRGAGIRVTEGSA